MQRISLILLGISYMSYATQSPIFEQLDQVLRSIDSLEGYGPVEEAYGLEPYLSLIHHISGLSEPSIEETKLAEDILSKIFSRYAYRDGSHRSRIYAQVQQKALTSLKATPTGQAILDRIDNPLIQAYRQALP